MKNPPNTYKPDDILVLESSGTGTGWEPPWYVVLNEHPDGANAYDEDTPTFNSREAAIDWCKQHNLDAYYETYRNDEKHDTVYQLVQVLTGRVIYESEAGAYLTNEGIMKRREVAKEGKD